MVVAGIECYEAMSALLKRKAPFSQIDKESNTSLYYYAAAGENLALRDASSEAVSGRKSTLLRFAAMAGHAEIVRYVLARGVTLTSQPNVSKEYALTLAWQSVRRFCCVQK